MEVMEAAFDPQWGEAWNRRQLTDSLLMPHNRYRLIDANGDEPAEAAPAAGFSLIKTISGEEELLLIAIRPELRGSGLGRELLQKFIDDARKRGAAKIFLEMRANNPADKLYRSMGFEPIGRREQYYKAANGTRIDAITMALSL
ncbi:ribosomal protein S18-alanine N-acetyltransferase [Altererythrobacter aestiaquae]|uniref:[Ribosomal protein bS18]-alanine N-acetyltransferase n=2 Tax=Pontixanthobacter aestiaquae TaxID=1509367 RepID=A0A844Z5V4_9SPHN|nr:ribosomal protein S18-alanine N-acetyltransferase [Pontixanthobacter aestiaquae]